MERQDVIINMRDLIYSIIRRWRTLAAAALIGCALVTGVQLLPKREASAAAPEKNEEAIEQLEANKQLVKDKQLQIENNLQKIRTNEELIQNKKNSIAQRETLLEEIEQVIEEYQNILTSAEGTLKTASQEAKGDIILAMTNAASGIKDLQSKKQSTNQEIINLKQEIMNLNLEIDRTIPQANEKLEQEIGQLEEDIADEEAEAETTGQSRPSLKRILMGIAAGMLLGIILEGVYLFVRYCLGGKLHDADAMRARYHYFILGELYKPSGRRNRLDRILANWAGYEFDLDVEKVYRMIAAHIMLLEDKPNVILLTGTVPSDQLNSVANGIGKKLAKAGITVQVQPDAFYDPEGILRVRDNPVIVAEAKDRSKLSEMDRQADLFEAANTKVLGAILL